jgi:glutamate formiminotransferase/formiminotetrahydrofolate cyclodeaminase
MMKKIIECIPNFSEGRDMNVIKQITDEIEKVEGAKLLDVDSGMATNRTVVTFVGEPEVVVEAAFNAIKKAAELIDMRKHHGEHPRSGATDVCPFVPVNNISMEEAAEYAHKLAKRVGEELKIPVYMYENAAKSERRKNLANCREGEYEGLAKKIIQPEWKPDYGPGEFTESIARTGLTHISARNFLVAINYNLNTTSTRRANAIAFDVREKGRQARENGKIDGKPLLNEKGEQVWITGSLKGTKAIGWYIEEYGIAQVSMNITNISETPVHVAFEEVCKKADVRGIRVTGCEIVGLLPKECLINAGKYFLRKQKRSIGVSEDEIIKIAVKSMGLSDLKPFHPKEKIVEYLIEANTPKKLIDLSCKSFADETASESPAPGGGSISAYVGVLGASLGTMVANLSAGKTGWDERWEEFSGYAERGENLMNELLLLVDEDTNAFNKIMNAFALPKKSEEEKQLRSNAIQEATKYAIEVPVKTMKTAYQIFDLCEIMLKNGNPNSKSDAMVGILCARAAVLGAFFNVEINCESYKDKDFVGKILAEATEIKRKAIEREKMIITIQ